MNKRAVLYARVSSDEQAEHGYSLQTQLDAMQKYAVEQGLEVVAEFVDDCSGTIRIYDRPQGKLMLAILERKEADVLIFHTADRLSRSLGHSVAMREEWQRAGIELHTVTRGKSENTAEARLTENVEAVIAEYEREKIMERSRRGRRAKAASGKWVGTGYAPYGYRREGLRREVRLVIDEVETAVVQRIFVLYIGRSGNKPMSFLTIAKLLTGEGVKPPGGASGPGRGWYESTVKKIICRTAYIGVFHYGGHTIALPELTIIEREAWDAAQLRRSINRNRAARNRKHEYLLSGSFFCVCGITMIGSLAHRKLNLAYYRCGRQTHYHHLPECAETAHVRADVADALVWGWLSELLRDDEKLQHGIRRRQERAAEELRPKRERLALLEELIIGTERKVQRLMAAFADESDETVSAILKAEVKALTKQKTALVNERDTLTAELNELLLTPEQEQELLATAAKLRTELPTADFETKRYFFDRLNVQAKLRRDEQGKRWMDVTCSITVNADPLPIDLPSSCNTLAPLPCSACASRRD